jgi:hypothetical protein
LRYGGSAAEAGLAFEVTDGNLKGRPAKQVDQEEVMFEMPSV